MAKLTIKDKIAYVALVARLRACNLVSRCTPQTGDDHLREKLLFKRQLFYTARCRALGLPVRKAHEQCNVARKRVVKIHGEEVVRFWMK